MVKGKCKLYGIETDLMKSHIIPKFAFDYKKKTGGRFLRSYENPGMRIQDGFKLHLLSSKAEQEFSKRERWFANNIFYPYLTSNKQSFAYDENLAYFIISVLWRVLIIHLDHPTLKQKNLHFLDDVIEEWKDFLAKFKYPRNYDNLNFLLTDRIHTNSTNAYSADLYTSRAIDATIITNDDNSIVGVYAKFLRFMFWSIVKGLPTKGENINIKFTKSNLIIPQIVRDDFIGSFIVNRIRQIDNIPELDELQRKKIIDEIVKNENDFWNSDAGKSMMNDQW